MPLKQSKYFKPGWAASGSVINELGFTEFKVSANFHGYLKFKSGM